MENDENNIVIIGGGFGGLRAAIDLLKNGVLKKGYRVILLDKSDFHTYNPLLYEVATGCNDQMVSDKKMALGVTARFLEYKKECGFEFYKGEVSSVDFMARKVFFKDASSLNFKALVFAVGSEADFFGISGLKETAFTLKNLNDALAIRKKIMELLDKRKEGLEPRINVMIGGGGATGVEFAAELASSFHHLAREGKIKNNAWAVTLVEAGPRLLSMLPLEISEHARRRLDSLGVKVSRDTCIKRVEGRRVILAPRPLKEGESSEELLCDFAAEAEKVFEPDILIWAGGIRANPLAEQLGLEVDKKGRLNVSDTMEVAGKERENVYAIGDCAVLTDPKTGQSVPALAQAAIEEARVAAKNIFFDLEGQNTRVHYKFRTYPVIAPLGGKSAIAYFGSIHFWGIGGWTLRQTADLRYFLSVLPFWKAVKMWLYGAWIYIHND